LHKAGLAHRLAVLTRAARRNVSHRETLRGYVEACAVVRAALAEAGIPPAGISCLRLGNEAAPELAALGDTPQLQQADAAFAAADPGLATQDGFAARAADLAPRFAGRPPPDPGASLLDWYAWSLAFRPRSSPRPGVAPH